MARSNSSKPNCVSMTPNKNGSEFHHVPVLETIPIESIRPAQVNDKIYRPVDPKDPSIIAMAREIANPGIGLLTPIAITSDNVILSGHRRYAACRVAGITHVKVERFPVSSTDPQFERLLVA